MAYGSVNADLMTTSDGVSSSGLYGFKNRILNGQMVIDQRNAGASVTPTTTGSWFAVDRFQTWVSQNSKLTMQQNAGSVTPPVGFKNYLGFTSSSAYSVASGDYFYFEQRIEGFNVADLGWGTASAKTVTLSFQVYSSLTGTFGGSILNSANNRSYPFTYTVSSANTWTPVSITIAGDTTGTWLTTNGTGIDICWGLGAGSTFSGTAGSWASAQYITATGAVSVVGTNGATFYLTGVQLEKGSTATSFDYRPYSAELAMCQRYFESTAFPDATFGITSCRGSAVIGGGGAACGFNFLVPKRTNAPTVTLYSRNGNAGKVSNNATGGDLSGTSSASSIGGTGFLTISMGASLSVGACIEAGWQASAEL